MKPEVILHSFGYLTQAAATTVAVSFAGIVFGFAIGALVCVARVSPRSWLKRLGGAYVSVFRGVPLLVQLLFIYYFLAEYGLDVPAIVAAVGALALSSAAYQAEILRGALNAVPRGQGEAATALGFSGLDIWRRILLPQALRISTPPLINEFILLIKASSLVSVVGIAELTRVSMNIATQTYRPLEAYVGGGLFYLAINLCLAGLGAACGAPPGGGRRPMSLDLFWHYAPSLLSGFGVTILCWAAGSALGLVLGFAITLLRRLQNSAAQLAHQGVHRAVPRHAVPGAALSPLRRRPVDRAQAQRRPPRASWASAFTRRPISPRSFAPASPLCRSARSRRRSASA